MSRFGATLPRGIEAITLLDRRIVEVDFRGITRLSSDISTHLFDFTWVKIGSTPHASAVTVLRRLLFTHSVIYASTCTRYVGQLLAATDAADGRAVECLGTEHVADFPNRYGLNQWPFVRAVLVKWADVGLPGLSTELIDYLRSPESFEEKDGGWYFTLVANDPERGAFTYQELKSIRDGVNRAFEQGVIDLPDWTLVWFLIATGVRPVQIARMRVGDVLVTTGPEGREITLSIPLAKGTQQVGRPRWKRKSPSVLTDVLLRYLELPHMAGAKPDAPLFVMQSRDVTVRIASIFKRIETFSERLGDRITIFPYRFRYTLGTRAIELGASDHEAARLLMHRSTKCVQYYRAALPTLQKPIADAIGPEMSFIAKAFQGRLIGTWEEATRKGEPGAVIRDFAHLVGQRLGACGTSAACHQHAPRACLTCRKFEPLSTAPWEQFLHVLLADLATETEDRIRLITQEQIDVVREIIIERDGLNGGSTCAA